MGTSNEKRMDDIMGWAARIGLAAVVLVVMGAAGLAYYASTLKPPHRTYHVVLSNDQFPN